MAHNPSEHGEQETSIGWRLYAIWQETRDTFPIAASKEEKTLFELVECATGVSRAFFPTPLGHLGIVGQVFSN